MKTARSTCNRGARILVLLGLLCAESLASRAAALSAPAGPQQEEERERERIRLFRLRDGEQLRVRSRWRGEGWELLQGRAWVLLDPARVATWQDERALLAEARRREEQLAGTGTEPRVELAGWLLEQGLFPESLDQLERVLREAPDHGPARALLERHPRLEGLPEREAVRADPTSGLRELLSVATAAGPARQELVIRELAAIFGAQNLERVLEHALATGSDRRRAFAALALRRLMPGGALRELYRRAALDPVEEVRRAAAWAIRDLDEPGLVLPLVRALESEHGAVRTYAAQSLGHMGPAAAPAEPALRAHLARASGAAAQSGGGSGGMSGSLHVSKQFAYVRDFDVEIAQGASIADPVVGVGTEGVFLDVRLGGVYTMSVAREVRMVRWALEQVTPREE